MRKTLNKIMAFAVAMIIVAAMAMPAMAATITVDRDDSYNQENGVKQETDYTLYKIFDAKDVSNESTVYTLISDDYYETLPGIFTAKKANDGKYYVTLNDGVEKSVVLSTLETWVKGNSTLFPGTTKKAATDDGAVSFENQGAGYYLIIASNGKNVVFETIGDDVTIDEKNTYPTLDKLQKKGNSDYIDEGYLATQAKVKAAIGQVIDYKLIVTIPKGANKAIEIVDKMSQGLTYNNDVAAKVDNASFEFDPVEDANNTFHIKFAATEVAKKNDGTKQIVITYSAKVNENAIIDDEKNNTATLLYDEGNYVLKDQVEYETYFGGIYKVDPKNDDADMSGVKFTLADGDGKAVYVTYDSDKGYYVVDPDSSSNEVETREDGGYYTIRIRGLDGDKTYKLTETKTVDGYNLLDGDTTLTLTPDAQNEDESWVFDTAEIEDTFDKVENFKGSTLPSTGGMGTTIFYVIGGILILAAAIVLISKKRVQQ